MRARRASRRTILIAAHVAALAVLAPSGAAAATVVNGGFEAGTLSGWNVHRLTEAGDWFAYAGTAAPIGRKRQPPAPPVQAPPQGEHAAIADQANPDTLILYQDVALEAGRDHWLSLLAYYDSYEPIAVPSPETLSVDGAQRNQQFRIDVMRPDAPIESVDPGDVFRTLLQTRKGDSVEMPPTRLTVDLSSLAGQTVRLRIANAASEEVFNAGVDAVSISETPPGQSPSRGGSRPKPGGPRLFSFGGVRANRANGIATLRVRVSGSGLVRATGGRVAAGASRTIARGGPRKTIEPVTVPVASPRTVTIHLRPTLPVRAILRQKRRLRVKVKVTYMPTGGTPEAASVPVVFELAPRGQRRR
jgi:hypothetical protein